MIDALLFAFQDAIRNAGRGYDEATCAVMPDGQPKPNCGEVFVAVHEGGEDSRMDNALDDYFDFALTLTQRVVVPWDRIGDSMLARALARRRGPQGQPSFNSRVEWLRAFGHMNWGVLQDANDLMVQWSPDEQTVHGFAEPARFKNRAAPALVGPEWFGAEPERADVGLKCELRFGGARRLQPIAEYL